MHELKLVQRFEHSAHLNLELFHILTGGIHRSYRGPSTSALDMDQSTRCISFLSCSTCMMHQRRSVRGNRISLGLRNPVQPGCSNNSLLSPPQKQKQQTTVSAPDNVAVSVAPSTTNGSQKAVSRFGWVDENE